MGQPSAFKTNAARAEYCRLYDEAIALSPVPVEESDVETSFGRTHVLTAGDPSKPPLVALHGFMVSSTMWLPLLAALTAKHHFRMLDVVGDLNKSVATGALESPARVVEWIDEVLDALQIGHTALVGLSFGSWMATQYAMGRPDRVERLAILAPAGIVSRQHVKWLVEMTLKIQLRPTAARVERAFDTFVMEQTRPKLREDPWRPIVQQFIVGSMSFRRNSRELRPVRCNIERLAASGIPVLVLIPRDETLHDGPTMAERFRQQLPHAQVELVDDANHLILIDQPEVVTEQLTKFLAPRVHNDIQ
jgi:pimeloyl-ACP methyl ester carboxylesterase